MGAAKLAVRFVFAALFEKLFLNRFGFLQMLDGGRRGLHEAGIFRNLRLDDNHLSLGVSD